MYNDTRFSLVTEMPQRVPTAGYTPPPSYDFSAVFAADSFDLSLLPGSDAVSDCTQLLSLYYDADCIADPDPPHMLPAASCQPPLDQIKFKPQPPPPQQQEIKQEPYSPAASSFFYNSPPYRCDDSPIALQFGSDINVKQEVCLDLGAILQESRYLQEFYADSHRDQEERKDSIIRSILEKDPKPQVQQQQEQESDHRLLREVLKDTSFQRKYNLKPFDLGGLGTAYKVKMEEESKNSCSSSSASVPASSAASAVVDLPQESFVEPMISMAIEQLKEDVVNTCSALGIPRDPIGWTEEDVRAWMTWNLRQYNHAVMVADYFCMPGASLVQLSEDEFQRRAPQCGSLLYAQLEIWKAACLEETNVDVSALLQDTSTQSSSSCGDASDDEDDDEMAHSPSMSSQASSHSGGGKVASSRSGGGGGGSHIHLWQFLKELLASPQLHGSCIRWLDRTKGVFKIEDSVRVARLWGKRKNRPAMNYDKLSRSIRQYYKKGIMKKTERSQRLVYQFCHPYSQ
ncbi:DNA-binding protein D-ETS-4 isoform X2 [Nilaparvata lugens]|uniref:DNA-binding protein D-ETS-4 isoform X2 n=1 Tax=Nilaparvata lugens TaxID=108931 RepID=UPI000B990B55|nr:DNA-binding protein D-ETS-4 isoform X2 [Nilaparvata lugens]